MLTSFQLREACVGLKLASAPAEDMIFGVELAAGSGPNLELIDSVAVTSLRNEMAIDSIDDSNEDRWIQPNTLDWLQRKDLITRMHPYHSTDEIRKACRFLAS
jgi:hypothetical protein